MNLGDIILKLRYRLNDVTGDVEGEYRDEELIKYINEALSWFCRVLREYKITKPDPSKQLTLTSSATKSTVEDYVDMPDEMFDIERVRISWSKTENGVTTDYKEHLVRKTKYDLEDLYPPQGIREAPRYFAVENKRIYIYPTDISQLYNLNIRGYAIQKLVNDYDIIDWFRENYETPFLDACEYMARRTRPTVDGNLQICVNLNNSVLQFFNERGRVEPRQAGVK